MELQNHVTEILGCRYPIVLGPMRLITRGKMASAVSNSGGFGVIAASGLSPDDLRQELTIAKELTTEPIGVNIPVYRPEASNWLDVAIKMGVRTIYTSAGHPEKLMDRIKGNGLRIIHKVSSAELARKAEASGVDAVVAMGYEAGGHIGRGDLTTFCLIPQLVDVLKIPVIASGGIADARGFMAAMALGALGVEIGTRFVATKECPVPDFFKQAICNCSGDATVVIGKGAMPIRVLKNAVIERTLVMNQTEVDRQIVSQSDARYVQEGGDKDTAVMPSGQTAGLIRSIISVEAVISEIVEGAKNIADQISKGYRGVSHGL